jgi:glycerol-3-phosphate acyltransferase PlsX
MTYKVALDVMGSDRGPATTLLGAKLALEKNPELNLLLVGREGEINPLVDSLGIDRERIEILHADEVITNYDSPTAVLFEKTNSSMVLALSAVAEREDIVGLVNASSTGALIAGTLKYLPSEKRVRPTLAAILPAERGGFVCLVDTGATIDTTPQILKHFAHLGCEFMKNMYGIENPKIGLLSNGAEETKGNKLVKETYPLLKEDPELNFVGNIEGSNALSGDCEVLVADGFWGNLVLKVTEGTAKRIITDIVKLAKSGHPEYMPLVMELMKKYDIASLGGGIILGAGKTVVKAHGASDEKAIMNTIGIVLNLAKNKSVFDTDNK